MNNTYTIDDVKKFWNNTPLFSGESQYKTGSKEFFEDHKNIYLTDCFPSYKVLEKIFVPEKGEEKLKVLDLGCGVGFWTIYLQEKSNKKYDFYSCDLTEKAIEITEKRLKIYDLESTTSIQNAEKTNYPDNYFDHINCQGVIHHTPDTDATIEEMYRILKPNGTAYISVYYKNFFLRNWKTLSFLLKPFLSKGGLKGRGRESIFTETDTDKITKLYDGDKNPIGKSYTKKDIIKMCSNKFIIKETFLNFFPARALPFKIPRWMHIYLSKKFGFMIHVNMKK